MKPNTIKRIVLALVIFVVITAGCRFIRREIAKRQTPPDTSSVQIVEKKATAVEKEPIPEPVPEEPKTEEEIIESDFYESVDAYDDVLQQELANAYYGEIYYGYGYVNADTIPELFVIQGDSHADMVSLYTIAADTGAPMYVGDFGGFGYCDYVPKEGSIISSYGGQGDYFIVQTGIDEAGGTFLKDIILRDASKEECKSYYGFRPDGIIGAVKKGTDAVNMIPSPDETFLISEEEADAVEARMREGSMRVSMNNICTNILRKAE